MVVEVVGGFLSNSLALISDAGHMLTHLLALLISLTAIIFAARPPTKEKTFGFYRLEILGALVNGVTLLLITAWILYEVYQRILEPREIASMQMLGIGFAGLVVNLLTALLLSGSGIRSMIARSAFLHVLGDAASSVGVVLGAILIYWTGQQWIDPFLSLMICVLILIWSYRLIMDSVQILLEAAPADVSYDEVKQSIARTRGVIRVHDLHIWTLTSGFYALSAHIQVQDQTLSQAEPLLRELDCMLCQRFQIGHITLQFECEGKSQQLSSGPAEGVPQPAAQGEG